VGRELTGDSTAQGDPAAAHLERNVPTKGTRRSDAGKWLEGLTLSAWNAPSESSTGTRPAAKPLKQSRRRLSSVTKQTRGPVDLDEPGSRGLLVAGIGRRIGESAAQASRSLAKYWGLTQGSPQLGGGPWGAGGGGGGGGTGVDHTNKASALSASDSGNGCGTCAKGVWMRTWFRGIKRAEVRRSRGSWP